MRHWTQAFWSKLSPLVDRALEMEPDARPVFLAAVRAEDEELAGALGQLVLEHDRVMASSFLESLPAAAAAPPSLAGQIVGAYTLESPIGSGGMGTVWLARRSDGRFEGHVAIKFINLAVFDRVGQDRFRREGTLLARLSHPNIARLHDAGVTASGQPFLVLEYIEGRRIDHHAAERRLSVEARLELFLQVADAVAHAHANLVVHRDLKPSNVLVDTHGQVKLLDFGIATLVDSGSPAQSTATLAALTPEYAAPEQVTGATVTTATDVYALGVLLFQLLGGTHPTAPPDATQATALRALAEHEAVRLSDAAGRAADPERIARERDTTPDRLRRACRGDLDTILAKALKQAPAERYQTVMAFADDIRRHLRREPVTARPDSVWYRTRRFAARHRLEVAAAAAAALALMLGAGIAVRQARVSAAERNRALEELRRAEATNDFSSFLLSEATPSEKPLTNADLLARGEDLIDRRYATDPLLSVHLRLVLAERHYENFQYDQWRHHLARAFEQSRTLPDVRLRSLAGCRMATALAERGEYARAATLIADALSALAVEDDAVAEKASCYLARSIAANMQGDAPHAIEAGEASLRLERARRGPAGSDVDALAALAGAYGTADRYADSDRAYAALMRSLDAQGRGATRNAAILLNNWAVALEAGGQLRRAAEQVQRARALVRQLDVEHGSSPAQLRTYGSILSTVGLHDAAIAAVDEAVAKARTGGSPLGLFWALGIATRVYGEAGRLDAADAILRDLRSVAASQAELPARERAAVDRFAALAALRRGQAAEAVEYANRALERLETSGRPDREKLPVVTILAAASNAAGRFETAKTTAERARQMAVGHLGQFEHSYQMGAALLELGIAEAALGRVDTARGWLREAVVNLRDAIGDEAPDARRAVARLAAIGG
ncbi:MAG TPA: serine/threonine-protein kinase [Vicinamibacterales bacterium]|jgi:serine/threonine-protein kinase|nr:serine/threonine-protein kinase [Vicinamibacterales bacterium]